MKVKVIKYDITVSTFFGFEFCGARKEKRTALLLQDSVVVTLIGETKVGFFVIDGKDDKGLVYLGDNWEDKALPEDGYQVIEEIDIPDQIVEDAVIYAHEFPRRAHYEEMIKHYRKIVESWRD